MKKSSDPAQSASNPPVAATGSRAAARQSIDATVRESSYLGDFYGDYWTSTEGKAEGEIPTIAEGDDDLSDASEPPIQATQDPASTTARIPSPAPVSAPELTSVASADGSSSESDTAARA